MGCWLWLVQFIADFMSLRARSLQSLLQLLHSILYPKYPRHGTHLPQLQLCHWQTRYHEIARDHQHETLSDAAPGFIFETDSLLASSIGPLAKHSPQRGCDGSCHVVTWTTSPIVGPHTSLTFEPSHKSYSGTKGATSRWAVLQTNYTTLISWPRANHDVHAAFTYRHSILCLELPFFFNSQCTVT